MSEAIRAERPEKEENSLSHSQTRTTGEAPVSGRRREFLSQLIGLSLGGTVLAMVSAVITYMVPPRKGLKTSGPIEVALEEDIPVGQGKVVPYKDTSVILVHLPEGFVALSAICTHAGCIVKWEAEQGRIFCPCHAGVFDVKGNVVSGPPPKALPPYQVQVVSGKVMVTG